MTDDGRADGSADASVDPAAAFGALANEVRVDIVRALGETEATDPSAVPYRRFEAPERGLSYSVLRDRSGVSDNGRFTYHLDQLLGTFVERSDERYRLTWLGVFAYRFMVMGRFAEGGETRHVSLDTPCVNCGGSLSARYSTDQVLYVDCRECGCRLGMSHVPRHGVTGRSDARLLDAAADRYRRQVGSLTRGFCPWCAGQVEGSVHHQDEVPGGDCRSQPVVTFLCGDCGGLYFPHLGSTLLSHPAVVSFFHERGVDLRDRRHWELPFVVDGDRVTVHDTDPWHVTVEARCADDRCLVDVDGGLDVESVTVE